MKKLIFDNIIFGLQRSGGISRYWQEILSRLIADAELTEVSFMEPKNAGENIFRQKIIIPEEKKRHQLQLPSNLMQFFPVRLSGPAVFHSSYFRYAIGKDVKNIITLYDCIYERFMGRSIGAWLHRIRTRSLKHADRVICISKSTADDVKHFYPYVDKDKIKVVHLAAGDEFSVMSKIPDQINVNGQTLDTNSYLLYVGKRGGYKNFSVLLKAMGVLKKKKVALPNILVVGGEKKMTPEDISLIDRLDMTDKIFRVEVCSAAELNMFYNCAKACVCTSLYEGFGLPVLEAFKAGCPVITANNSSLAEVAQGAALLYDAEDPNGLAAQIDSISGNVLADKFRNAGADRARSFSWDRTYAETKKIYRSLLING